MHVCADTDWKPAQRLEAMKFEATKPQPRRRTFGNVKWTEASGELTEFIILKLVRQIFRIQIL